MRHQRRTPTSDKYIYTSTAESHFGNLLVPLVERVYRTAELHAEKIQQARPIDVTPNDFDKAFNLFVSNPPRSKWYRLFHIIVTLFSGIGIALILSGIFEASLSAEHKILNISLGLTINILSILVDSFLLDKKH